MMINRVRETMLGAVLAVGLTGCAAADPFVGPSSHDAGGLRALLADRVEVAYDAAGRGRGIFASRTGSQGSGDTSRRLGRRGQRARSGAPSSRRPTNRSAKVCSTTP